MKISEVKEKILANETIAIEMMRNPTELSEWVIWIRESDGKSYYHYRCKSSATAIALAGC